MCKELFLVSFALLLATAGSSSAEVAIDDFESYADTATLQTQWALVANYGGSPTITLDATGGAGTSQAMSFNAGGPGGGIVRYSAVSPTDWSSQTHVRLWQKTIVSGATTINDVVWRLSIKAGANYYDTELYNPDSNVGGGDQKAFLVNGFWGGGAAGAYIDLPLAGYGDGSGPDDWKWKQTTNTGTFVAPDLTSVTELQFISYNFQGSGGSYSTLFDDIAAVPEPTTLISDDFNRADSTNLWQTAEGFDWARKNTSAVKPVIFNGTIHWEDSSEVSYVSGVAAVKDFAMDFDYSKPTEQYLEAHSFNVGFRVQDPGTTIGNGGDVAGYRLAIATTAANTITVTIFADIPYGGELVSGTATVADSWNAHITLLAEGSRFRVWVDDADMSGDATIDYDDIGSGNPGNDAAGYFSFYGNGARDFAMDNIVVRESSLTGNFVIFSDRFSGYDNEKNIGSTDQGSLWTRRVLGDANDVNDPGINDSLLIWTLAGTSYTPDAIYLDDVEAVKNFVLEFDYIRITDSYADTKAIVVDSRKFSRSGLVSDGGDTTGVRVLVKQPTATTVNVGIYAEPDSEHAGAAVNTGGLGGHIKILAIDNVYEVYITDVNGVEQLSTSYTVPSNNAASEDAGFVSLSASSVRDHGIDNVVYTRLAEYCGDIATVYRPGDVNKDCYVNLLDFAELASDWMECVDPSNAACSNWWN